MQNGTLLVQRDAKDKDDSIGVELKQVSSDIPIHVYPVADHCSNPNGPAELSSWSHFG